MENKGESDQFLEILGNLETLEILEIPQVKRPLFLSTGLHDSVRLHFFVSCIFLCSGTLPQLFSACWHGPVGESVDHVSPLAAVSEETPFAMTPFSGPDLGDPQKYHLMMKIFVGWCVVGGPLSKRFLGQC